MSEQNKEFEERNQRLIKEMGADKNLRDLTAKWFNDSFPYEYTYHFRWMGMPIIQYPQDMVAMQEIIWQVKPDLIIETGIARGGSLIFYASMLRMMDIDGEVVGVDIDIRQHNREAIEAHPMCKYITMFEGSSIDGTIVEQVKAVAANKQRVLVVLDSLHTHDHVLKELELYSPFVTKDSYLVVFDTVIEDMNEAYSNDRPWSHGNNPKTAVYEFLKSNDRFKIDPTIIDKLLISVAPDGYLRCVQD